MVCHKKHRITDLGDLLSTSQDLFATCGKHTGDQKQPEKEVDSLSIQMQLLLSLHCIKEMEEDLLAPDG